MNTKSFIAERWSNLPSVDKIRWMVAALTFAGLIATVLGIWMNFLQTTLLSDIRDETSTKYSGNFRTNAENLDKILAELDRVKPLNEGDKPSVDNVTIITDQFAYGSVTAYPKFFSYINALRILASAGAKIDIFAFNEKQSIEDVRAQFTEERFQALQNKSDEDARIGWAKIEKFFRRKVPNIAMDEMTYDRFLKELMLQEENLVADMGRHPKITMKRPVGNLTFPVFVWYLNLGSSDERAFFSFVDAMDESNEFTFFTREPNLLKYLRGVIEGVRDSTETIESVLPKDAVLTQ